MRIDEVRAQNKLYFSRDNNPRYYAAIIQSKADGVKTIRSIDYLMPKTIFPEIARSMNQLLSLAVEIGNVEENSPDKRLENFEQTKELVSKKLLEVESLVSVDLKKKFNEDLEKCYMASDEFQNKFPEFIDYKNMVISVFGSYAHEHSELPAYNRVQDLIKQIQVRFGGLDFVGMDKAIETLRKVVRSKNYIMYADMFNFDYEGEAKKVLIQLGLNPKKK